MFATQHQELPSLTDEELAAWEVAPPVDETELETIEEDFDDDYLDDSIWTDAGLSAIASGEIDERNQLLGELRELTLSSIGGYQEVLEFSTDEHLQAFAEVVIRQRLAQYQALSELQTHDWGNDTRQPKTALNTLRSEWRLAIWNLEQDRREAFLDHAEQAESRLEEAYLAAAAAFDDADWSERLTDAAVMICGARDVWEELADDLQRIDSPKRDVETLFELEIA